MNTFIQQEINKRTKWVYFSNYRWIAHVAYWTWVLVFGTLLQEKEPITPDLLLNHFVLANLNIFIFYYFYCLFLIPYLFKRNKHVLFWLMLFISFFAITVNDVYFNLRFIHYSSDAWVDPKNTFWHNYRKIFFGYIYEFLIFTMLLFFMEKNEENSLVLELEEEKKEIETVKLDLLKTNISPDFLMRSLKQLKKAAAAQEFYAPTAIITFSELLRYRLYRGKQLQTPLAEEIEALQKFIDFVNFDQQNNNLIVKLEIKGDYDGKSVAPLALINILEPFCKIIPEHPAALSLQLFIEADQLALSIVYDKIVKGQLLADLNQYGNDYTLLYGDNVHFNFENCIDDTCKIEMRLPLISAG